MIVIETTWGLLVGTMGVCVGLAAGVSCGVVDRSLVVTIGH